MSVNDDRSTSVANSSLAYEKGEQSRERVAPLRFPFTEARLSELKPKGRTTYCYDFKCQGLAVRTTPKAKTFCFYGRLHNKVVRITLGRVGRLSLTDARNAVERIRGDAAKGIDVVAVRKALATKKPTAERLADRFERFLAGDRHRPKTVKDYRSLWTLHIAPTLANKAVDDIQPEDLQKLHAAVASRVGSGKKAMPGRTKPGHRTANKVLALLRALMGGRAIEVSMFPQRDRRRRLTDEEAARLRDALIKFEEPWREFFALSLHTGTRRQSLLTMRWDDVDLRRATWTIPAHWSKHGDEVLVPLTAEATALLSEMKIRRGASAWVFPSSRSSSGHITEPKKAWARPLKAAGIEGLTIHDLRRTFGSRLAESGASGVVIAAAMGHKSLQSAKPYLHLQVEIVRQHMERASVKRGD